MIVIRAARMEDAARIAAAHAEAHWQAYAPLFGRHARALDTADLERCWRQAIARREVALVAADGASIVGVACAEGSRIEALYILANYRRQGIGCRLMAGMLSALRERGVAEARFDVLAINAHANAFYSALGARVIGRRANGSPGEEFEDLVYAISTSLARR
jgi:ribosomal protein S18 acetylase RimI-like enzyme